MINDDSCFIVNLKLLNNHIDDKYYSNSIYKRICSELHEYAFLVKGIGKGNSFSLYDMELFEIAKCDFDSSKIIKFKLFNRYKNRSSISASVDTIMKSDIFDLIERNIIIVTDIKGVESYLLDVNASNVRLNNMIKDNKQSIFI